MSQDAKPEHVSERVMVYRIPGMDAVEVRRDVEYRAADAAAGALTMDVYYPPGAKAGAPVPAVVLVAGFPDPGYEAKLGCKFKETGSSRSWGRLLAASGLAAITYTNREPAADIHALLAHLRRTAAALGIDADRLGLWATSGNVPVALSVLMREDPGRVKCAVLCYGYTLDLDGSGRVAEASAKWGFVNPCAGKSVADLPARVPLFVARAGRDEIPHLNETLDRFLAHALTHNLPVTLTNHPAAPHAFDLFDDSGASREVVRQALAFTQSHLLKAVGRES